LDYCVHEARVAEVGEPRPRHALPPRVPASRGGIIVKISRGAQSPARPPYSPAGSARASGGGDGGGLGGRGGGGGVGGGGGDGGGGGGGGRWRRTVRGEEAEDGEEGDEGGVIGGGRAGDTVRSRAATPVAVDRPLQGQQSVSLEDQITYKVYNFQKFNMILLGEGTHPTITSPEPKGVLATILARVAPSRRPGHLVSPSP
jgi:hypothetical protein